ncbi:prolyl oligopeptidase family serine peptidase [Pseudoduganella umbonata]|uniref:Dipeptidyl aminopeptidase/acylaminoacyl peptidase n=1 Tax=Pseudoduganella umbonata TaxID=864828 RepID=A0A4P8HUD0_9BURK|nr:prolyl oligopeptidase family serine peptidase [Pseudoduganella umbonata]MBB3220449.1 dipeptidyl aminopeptidase/acylaminoacyl peptidase [Pseudoduganella umbonata]QCP12025.1 S9 family peptidase [Pseudoduganella umbonata]
MPTSTLLAGALLAATLLLSGRAAAAPPPVQDFFDNAEFGGAQLSPSGRHLAAKVSAAEGGRDRLAVVDLATLDAKVVASFSDGDIGHFQWVSDNRLLFDSTDKDLAPGEVNAAPGLYAVDRDGRNFRPLAERRGRFVRAGDGDRLLPWHTYMLPQPGAQDSDSVYVRSVHFETSGAVLAIELLRLDTRTGRTTDVMEPGHVLNWMLDARGEPRMAITLEQGKHTIWLLENSRWRVVTTFDGYVDSSAGFEPLEFAADGLLYVAARRNGDRRAVHVFDPATGKVGDRALFALDRHDFSGHLIQVAGKLAGIRYKGDSEDTVWLDPELKALQATIDGKLPGNVNLVEVPRRPETPYVLVTTYSDRQPKVFLLYNRETGKFSPVGKAHPRIQARQMGTQENVLYTARDGLPVPGLLTLPAGAGRQDKLPMVVLVHGGPWVRGTEWGWSADAQFLASRGYAVLEPEFRGSTGYGARHFTAGLKQWGLAMQDDVADGARWAIAQGIADPQRICIAGASYGGYATLMGLIRDPDLYRCGVAWAGVADLRLMYGSWLHGSDFPKQYMRYGMPQLIGDLEKDAAQLTATSPVEQAARLRQPLLLAHGSADRRVPRAHGVRFRDAVAATNRQVEWVEYEDEGHGWTLPKNRFDFWTRVEKFLDRHIGAGAAAAK